jgi:microcystin-dependent protein
MMHRTTAQGSVDGKYIDDDIVHGIVGTMLIAKDRNTTQEELANAVEGAGITLDPEKDDQLLEGLRKGHGSTFNADSVDGLHAVDLERAMKIGAVMMFDANSVPVVFTAGQFVVGLRYKIVSLGTTNFTLIGAAQNVIGTVFTATGVGAGTGTASSEEGISGAWVDDVTMPGWFACVAANTVWGCKDMTGRFVMGKVVAGVGGTGGTNSYQISSAQLPTHTHTIDHDHGAANTGGRGSYHQHSDSGHTHDIRCAANGGTYLVWNTSIWAAGTGDGPRDSVSTVNKYTAYTSYANIGNDNTDHVHAFDMPAFSGSSGNGGFANSSVDNRPAYYEMIFIRKCK